MPCYYYFFFNVRYESVNNLICALMLTKICIHRILNTQQNGWPVVDENMTHDCSSVLNVTFSGYLPPFPIRQRRMDEGHSVNHASNRLKLAGFCLHYSHFFIFFYINKINNYFCFRFVYKYTHQGDSFFISGMNHKLQTQRRSLICTRTLFLIVLLPKRDIRC